MHTAAFRFFVFSLLLWASAAIAQPVQQSGHVTTGHQTIWSGQGLIGDGGGQAINTPLTGGSTSSLAASSTTYCATSGCNSSQAIAALSTVSGSLTNLYFSLTTAPGGLATATVTLLTGSYGILTNTGVTCTITGVATSCSDTSHLATIAAGQSWALQVVMSSGAVSTGGQSFGVQLTSVYPAPLPTQGVRQSGNITAGHAVVWTTQGVVADAGFGLLGPLSLTFPGNTVFGNPTNSLGAPSATNVPTASTPAVGDNSLRLATTAFVNGSFPKVLTGFAGVDNQGLSDSTTGIQNALNSGGVILAPCGTYLIDGTVTVSNPVTLIGCAWNFSNGGSFKGTSFRTANDGLHLTNDFFHIESDDVHFSNINCQGLAGRYALSMGSCIALGTDGISHNGFTLTNVSSNSNSQLLNIENANFFKLDGIDSNDYYGITINNANADNGAGSISNSIFNQSGSGIGIQWFANGDLRITNSKFLCAAYPIYMDWNVGDSGNFELSNSSFENYNSAAIRFNMQSHSFTGVNITGNRFGGGGGPGCGTGASNVIFVDNSTTGTLSNVVFADNIIDVSGNPANGNLIDLGKISQFMFRNNLIVGNAAASGGRVGIAVQSSAANGDISRNSYFGLATNISPGGTNVTSVAPVVDGGTGQNTFTANLPLVGNGTSAIAQGTRSGNTTTYTTTTGPLMAGNCVKIDAFGNLVDNGGVCGTGGIVASPSPQGRLTLTSGTPVMTADVAGATSIFYTPSVGNIVPIYNGTSLVPTVFSQLTNVTTDATKNPAAVANNSNYDLFVWNDSGTVRLGRGPAWTNGTSLATRLTLILGTWVNTSSITNGPASHLGTYVGSIRSNGTATVDMNFTQLNGFQFKGGLATLGVYNAYNQVLMNAFTADEGSNPVGPVYNWTTAFDGSGGAAESLDGSVTNRVNFIQGLQDNSLTIAWQGDATTDTGLATPIFMGWCLDNTNCFTQRWQWANATANSYTFQPSMTYSLPPQYGFHFIQRTQASGDTAGPTTHTATYTGGPSPFNDNFTLSIWD